MAYNLAVEQRAFINVASGSGTIAIRYTGNAGETPITIEYSQSLSSAPNADFLRSIAINQLNILNTTANFIAAQTPLPITLDTTTPITPPAGTLGNFIAASDPFTPGTTPTDIATIFGSASKSVIVTGISLVSVQTTVGINTWKLIKRSTANTSGTSSSLIKVPTNSNFPTATATVLQYSVNPTLGTAVGNVWSGKITSPSLTSLVGSSIATPMLSQSIPLNGIAQGLAINFGGVALPAGLSVQLMFCWTEQ